MYLCAHIHIYVHIHIYIYVSIHIYTHKYIHMYIYTRTQNCPHTPQTHPRCLQRLKVAMSRHARQVAMSRYVNTMQCEDLSTRYCCVDMRPICLHPIKVTMSSYGCTRAGYQLQASLQGYYARSQWGYGLWW